MILNDGDSLMYTNCITFSIFSTLPFKLRTSKEYRTSAVAWFDKFTINFYHPAPVQPPVLNLSDYLPMSTSRHHHHFAIAFQTVRNFIPQTINLQPSSLLHLCLVYA